MTAFDYVSIALLVVFIIASWFVPRHWGVAGMVLVQFALLITYFVLACIAMKLGRYEYDGLLSVIGLAFQAFLLNSLLLPIALVALLRRRRGTGTQRGFPVVRMPPEGDPGRPNV
jgi:hypothetical protein